MGLDTAFSHITAILVSQLLNNKMNLLPNIIPMFIFFWLSKTKTNRKKIPMTVRDTVSSISGTKQSLPIVSGEPAMRHELIKQDPKRSGWLRTNRQVSAEPDSWLVWPQVLRGVENICVSFRFLKVEHSQFLPLFLCDLESPLSMLQMANFSGRHIARSC